MATPETFRHPVRSIRARLAACGARPGGADQRGADQRGAVIPLVALAIAALITSTSFAVDLGRLTDRKRSMQAVADLAAADAIRVIEATASPTFVPATVAPSVLSATQASATRNQFAPAAGDALSPEIGTWNKLTGFLPIDPTSPAYAGFVPKYVGGPSPVFAAVRVTAGTTVAFLFGAGSRFTQRTGLAIWSAGTAGCAGPCGGGGGGGPGTSGFAIGSFLLGYSTAPAFSPEVTLINKLLGAELGTSYSGTLVGYQGLASGSLTLADLVAANPALGTPDSLLTSTVSVKTLLLAAATALSNKGGSPTAVADLNGLAATVPAGKTIKLGDLISVGPGAGAAAAATFNVLSFLQGVATVAGGSNAANLSSVIPGLTSVTTSLIQPMQTSNPASGPADGTVTALTAQIAATLHLTSPVGASLLDLPVSLGGGRASGVLSGVACGVPTPASTSEVSVSTSALTVIAGPATVLGLPVTTSPPVANVAGIDPASPSKVSFTGIVAGVVKSTGTTTPVVSLPALSVTTLPTVSILIKPLVQPVVDTLLAGLNSNLTPLLSALGLQVAGADILTSGILNCP